MRATMPDDGFGWEAACHLSSDGAGTNHSTQAGIGRKRKGTVRRSLNKGRHGDDVYLQNPTLNEYPGLGTDPQHAQLARGLRSTWNKSANAG